MSYLDVFDESRGRFLLVGESGSGKTSALFALAHQLIERARKSLRQARPEHRIVVPVYVPLASWSNGELTLEEWLIREIKAIYHSDEDVIRRWLTDDGRIVLLLDALDGVDHASRVELVHRLNDLGGVAGLVVTCEYRAYKALMAENALLRLSAAVQLNLLTREQVLEALAGHHTLAGLRAQLLTDRLLLEMSRTPLMLDVMIDVYSARSEVIPTIGAIDDPATRRRRVLEAYVERIFETDDGKPFAFEEKLSRRWLRWLALQMTTHRQAVLLVERIQPSWLPRPWERAAYLVGTRLAEALLGGLALGLLIALLIGMTLGMRVENIVPGIVLGILIGFVTAPVLVLVDLLRFRFQPGGALAPPPVRKIVAVALPVLVFSFAAWGAARLFQDPLIMFVLILVGIGTGLFFGLKGKADGLLVDVRMVERLVWSARSALWSGLAGLGIGAVLGAGLGFLFAADRVEGMLRLGLGWAVLGAVIGVVFLGWRTSDRPRFGDLKLNQGIRWTLRTVALGSTRFALGMTVIFGTIATAQSDSEFGLMGGALAGVGFGLVAAFWYRGMDVLRHYALRALLALLGYMPWRLGRFLSYAERLTFLKRAGGGYFFAHRYFLEYFSESTVTSAHPRSAPAPHYDRDGHRREDRRPAPQPM